MPQTKEQRQKHAKILLEQRAKRTDEQQLAHLGQQPARKERKRLQARIEAAKTKQ